MGLHKLFDRLCICVRLALGQRIERVPEAAFADELERCTPHPGENVNLS